MPADLSQLITGVRGLLPTALDGGGAEMDAESASLVSDLRASIPHGIDTGATEASMTVVRVGRGADGAGALQAALAAVEALNPGRSASGTVTIQGELGALAYSGTNYQEFLETVRGGRDATLGPFVQRLGERMTRAFARGSKRVLGG